MTVTEKVLLAMLFIVLCIAAFFVGGWRAALQELDRVRVLLKVALARGDDAHAVIRRLSEAAGRSRTLLDNALLKAEERIACGIEEDSDDD